MERQREGERQGGVKGRQREGGKIERGGEREAVYGYKFFTFISFHFYLTR